LPYYIQLDERLQTVQFRPLPRGLEEARTITQRQLRDALRAARREHELDTKPNLVVEAQRYADLLDRNPELTKGRVAAELGVSRIRIYQMLNVLNLPQAILEFIVGHDTPEAKEFLTERRLRPLVQLKDASQQLALFRRLLHEAGLAVAFGSPD